MNVKTAKLRTIQWVTACLLLTCMAPSLDSMARADKPAPAPTITVAEARGRAKLLQEAFHATLHIVHLRYYREDEGLIIPARTFKLVFRELQRRQHVNIRWLAVNASAMNVDHEPKDAFEKAAVKALADGKPEYEAVEKGVYRHVGAITLTSECLKCHVPHRTNLDDRVAGLAISMAVKEK